MTAYGHKTRAAHAEQIKSTCWDSVRRVTGVTARSQNVRATTAFSSKSSCAYLEEAVCLREMSASRGLHPRANQRHRSKPLARRLLHQLPHTQNARKQKCLQRTDTTQRTALGGNVTLYQVRYSPRDSHKKKKVFNCTVIRVSSTIVVRQPFPRESIATTHPENTPRELIYCAAQVLAFSNGPTLTLGTLRAAVAAAPERSTIYGDGCTDEGGRHWEHAGSCVQNFLLVYRREAGTGLAILATVRTTQGVAASSTTTARQRCQRLRVAILGEGVHVNRAHTMNARKTRNTKVHSWF